MQNARGPVHWRLTSYAKLCIVSLHLNLFQHFATSFTQCPQCFSNIAAICWVAKFLRYNCEDSQPIHSVSMKTATLILFITSANIN